MKKIFLVLSVFVLLFFVSCDKAKPEPALGDEIAVADISNDLQAVEEMKVFTFDMEMKMKQAGEEIKVTLNVVADVDQKKVQYKMNSAGYEVSIAIQSGKLYGTVMGEKFYCNATKAEEMIFDLQNGYASPNANEVPLEDVETAHLNVINENEKVMTYKGKTLVEGISTDFEIRFYITNNKMVKMTTDFSGDYEAEMVINIREEANFSTIVEEEYTYNAALEQSMSQIIG